MDWINPQYRHNGHADGTNDTLASPISTDGTPESGRLYEVPARQGRAVLLRSGQRLQVVNTFGTQVCDLWAFCHGGLHEAMSMTHSRASFGRITPRVGDELVTNRRRPILGLLADSSLGVHDTLVAACDLPRYRLLGVAGYHDNCSDNLRLALQAIGLKTDNVPAPFNVWMNNPVAPDGTIGWASPTARPGDTVEFEACVDCVVVMSACPQDLVPVNGVACKPKSLQFRVLDALS